MLQQLTSSKAYARQKSLRLPALAIAFAVPLYLRHRRPETNPDTQAAPVVAPEEMEPPKPRPRYFCLDTAWILLGSLDLKWCEAHSEPLLDACFLAQVALLDPSSRPP